MSFALPTAPRSTKKATQARDLEIKAPRKGNQRDFGIKVHVGTDRRGVDHSLMTTDAATAETTQLLNLLHGKETALLGDEAYDNADFKQHAKARAGRHLVNNCGLRTPYPDAINATRSRSRERTAFAPSCTPDQRTCPHSHKR